MDYKRRLILAPMVRVSTLPFRLMCLEYGADIVFTEELIDWKLLRSVRQVNDRLGTVDYVDPDDGTVTLRTCAAERARVVLQMGTCDPDRARQVVLKYQQDVAGIDVNMGCPKEFSIKGGMGAALLTQPEKVRQILTALVQAATIPVTCKIRLLESDEDTLNLCRLAESCGIAALTVHGRTRHMRPRHPVNAAAIANVARHLSIPVIANGGSREIRSREDAEKWRDLCGTSSVMLARAAMWDASVFRREGLLPMDDVIAHFLQLCLRYEHPFPQAKYTVQQILRDLQQTPRGRSFLATATLHEICELWGVGVGTGDSSVPDHDQRPLSKRPRLEEDTVPGHSAFIRAHYKPEELPKTLLHDWCTRQGEPVPRYQVTGSEKLFRAVCTVRARRYASLWEKSKKFAEQGAALTCVQHLAIVRVNKDKYEESAEVIGQGDVMKGPKIPDPDGVNQKVPGLSGQAQDQKVDSIGTNQKVSGLSGQALGQKVDLNGTNRKAPGLSGQALDQKVDSSGTKSVQRDASSCDDVVPDADGLNTSTGDTVGSVSDVHCRDAQRTSESKKVS